MIHRFLELYLIAVGIGVHVIFIVLALLGWLVQSAPLWREPGDAFDPPAEDRSDGLTFHEGYQKLAAGHLRK